MTEQSSLDASKKILLSIFFGLLSLCCSPYGIVFIFGQAQIDIPWSQLFPILLAMSLGWRFGLLSGLAGGAYFPFYLWANNGWANVTTALSYLILFILLGIATDKRYIKRLTIIPLRIFLAVSIYITLNYLYDHFLFNVMLSMNPTFWVQNTISHFDLEILYGFAFKDAINVIALTLAADTLLRLPFVRRLVGLAHVPAMQANPFIFRITLFIPVLVWLAFIGLGFNLLKGHNALQYEHKSFALLVILANGFLVSRVLFYFSEKQFYTQSKLNESEQKYRTIFLHVQDVFYQIDLDGIVTEVSPSAVTLSGYSREELIGKPFTCLRDNNDDQPVNLFELLKDGELRDYELTFRTKQGALKYISLSTHIISDVYGKAHHIDGVIRDISERKQYALEIETQNQKLHLQNKELEQFAYIASHDLQEPLQTLTRVSELVKEEYKGKLDQQADTYIDFIIQSSQRMRTLVKGLLDYARIGNAGDREEVDVQQVVQDIAIDLSASIQESSAILYFHDLPVVKAHAMELRQLFQHLISNAIKFRKDDAAPIVRIEAKKESGHWTFSVTDNGIGIHPKDKEKIFVIFKRLHNRNQYEGTGIGLAHGKKIVALHGGNIWIDSTPGKGSTFYFTIPLL